MQTFCILGKFCHSLSTNLCNSHGNCGCTWGGCHQLNIFQSRLNSFDQVGSNPSTLREPLPWILIDFLSFFTLQRRHTCANHTRLHQCTLVRKTLICRDWHSKLVVLLSALSMPLLQCLLRPLILIGRKLVYLVALTTICGLSHSKMSYWPCLLTEQLSVWSWSLHLCVPTLLIE